MYFLPKEMRKRRAYGRMERRLGWFDQTKKHNVPRKETQGCGNESHPIKNILSYKTNNKISLPLLPWPCIQCSLLFLPFLLTHPHLIPQPSTLLQQPVSPSSSSSFYFFPIIPPPPPMLLLPPFMALRYVIFSPGVNPSFSHIPLLVRL